MTIFLVEDEALLLRMEEKTLREAVPGAQVMGFPLGRDALNAIQGQGIRPDIVFSDIEMPGLSGLEFAVKLKNLCPDAKIIFVTSYPQYALEAYRIHARGYILKPMEADRVREEIAALQLPVAYARDKLEIHCFGEFEVFWQGKPLTFGRRQTKELLAFLVDREGRMCASEEVIAAIWEEEGDLKAAKARLRNLIMDLRHTLEKIGMGDAIIRRSGMIALRRERTDCDYYRLLEKDTAALNSYRGEYMNQYSWAEPTEGKLYFQWMK